MAYTFSAMHFSGTAEAAFTFYKSVFGTEFTGPITRWGDLPAMPGMPEMSEEDKQLVMNVELPITGGHLLVGNDAPAFMGTVVHGSALDIGIAMDTRAEGERIFAALADGGTIDMPLDEEGSEEYCGSVIDKFGTTWMIAGRAKQ